MEANQMQPVLKRLAPKPRCVCATTASELRRKCCPRYSKLFTQAERGADRSQGDLGIGLTLVKRLVQMHHGRVEASSAGLATGSEFSVHLPLTTPPQITDALENALEGNAKDARAPVGLSVYSSSMTMPMRPRVWFSSCN